MFLFCLILIQTTRRVNALIPSVSFLVLVISIVNTCNFKEMSVFSPVLFDTYFKNNSFTCLNQETCDVAV